MLLVNRLTNMTTRRKSFLSRGASKSPNLSRGLIS
jgi:hypothetical protein